MDAIATLCRAENWAVSRADARVSAVTTPRVSFAQVLRLQKHATATTPPTRLSLSCEDGQLLLVATPAPAAPTAPTQSTAPTEPTEPTGAKRKREDEGGEQTDKADKGNRKRAKTETQKVGDKVDDAIEQLKASAKLVDAAQLDDARRVLGKALVKLNKVDDASAERPISGFSLSYKAVGSEIIKKTVVVLRVAAGAALDLAAFAACFQGRDGMIAMDAAEYEFTRSEDDRVADNFGAKSFLIVCPTASPAT
jgi:hypothetical protein